MTDVGSFGVDELGDFLVTNMLLLSIIIKLYFSLTKYYKLIINYVCVVHLAF